MHAFNEDSFTTLMIRLFVWKERYNAPVQQCNKTGTDVQMRLLLFVFLSNNNTH
jgi:hypothetical protein